MYRCGNSQRNRNDKYKNQTLHIQLDGVGHGGACHLHHWHFIHNGITKIPHQHIAHPGEILDINRLIQSQFFTSCLIQGLIPHRIHIVLASLNHQTGRIAWHCLVDAEHHNRNDEKYKDNVEKPFQNVFYQSNRDPFSFIYFSARKAKLEEIRHKQPILLDRPIACCGKGHS